MALLTVRVRKSGRWVQFLWLAALPVAPLTVPPAGALPQGIGMAMRAFSPVPLDGLAELRDRNLKLLVIRALEPGERPPVEGHRQERMVVSEQADRAEVLLEQMGLLDDSVRGIRTLAELAREGEQWKFTRLGRQWICQPGRGQAKWAAGPCR
jgi:hypothetical protein